MKTASPDLVHNMMSASLAMFLKGRFLFWTALTRRALSPGADEPAVTAEAAETRGQSRQHLAAESI
jgi:hypothetical protein